MFIWSHIKLFKNIVEIMWLIYAERSDFSVTGDVNFKDLLHLLQILDFKYLLKLTLEPKNIVELLESDQDIINIK